MKRANLSSAFCGRRPFISSLASKRLSLSARRAAGVLLLLLSAVSNTAAVAQSVEPKSGKPEEIEVPSGFRKLAVARYGITVLIPDSWRLVGAERGDRAFQCTLPTDHPNMPPAIAACEIGLAPASLEEYRKRIEQQGKQPGGMRKLLSNEIVKPENGSGLEYLEVNWSLARPGLGTWYEVKRYVLRDGRLYTFTLVVDEGHYEAYRLDFRAMVAGARFSNVDTGLVKRDDGFWMHRETGLGLQLPPEWRPAFPPSDEILLFATGSVQEVFSDNLVVTSSPAGKIPFDELKRELTEEIPQLREGAKVVRCEVVMAGGRPMLETVIEAAQGPFEFTIFERRFEGERFNYQVRYTVLRSGFEKLEEQIKKSADSAQEFPLPKKERTL